MIEPVQSIAGAGPPQCGADGAWIWQSRPQAVDTTVLSGVEVARVTRLVSPEKQNILAASLVRRRHLLSDLLGCAADQLQIMHDDVGKPCLPGFPDVEISFSDSEGWNALTLSRTGPVGVDVEFVRPVSWEPMLNMLAQDEEACAIRAVLAERAGLDTFFRCWTAKEAILKAVGTGLKGGAPRITLPASYISGQSDQFTIVHDELALAVETNLVGSLVVSRALAI